nr:uncharacterized protein I203_05538 [Kwoniella mangroviensis CBS 8507]OCF65292.1 hypothetical protein I203_05538 [Kwoniella mangroviensis CBS 8507]
MDNDTTDTTAYYTTGPASTVSFDTTSSNMVDTGAGSEQSKKERRHGGGTPKTRCERCTTKHLKCDSTSQDGASSCTHCDTAWEPCSFCPEEFKEVLAKWQKENAPAKVKKTRSSKACDECYKDKKNPKCEFLPDGSSSCTRCTKLKRSCTFQIKRQRGTWGELMGCPADVQCQRCFNAGYETKCTYDIPRGKRGSKSKSQASASVQDVNQDQPSLPPTSTLSPREQLDEILKHTNHGSSALDPEGSEGFIAAWNNSDAYMRLPEAPWH